MSGKEPDEAVYASLMSSFSSSDPECQLRQIPSSQQEKLTLVLGLVLIQDLPVNPLKERFKVRLPAHLFRACKATFVRLSGRIISAWLAIGFALILNMLQYARLVAD